MKELKYYCDICGAEVKENDIGKVFVAYESSYLKYNSRGHYSKEIDICESCASEIVIFDDDNRLQKISDIKNMCSWLKKLFSKEKEFTPKLDSNGQCLSFVRKED